MSDATIIRLVIARHLRNVHRPLAARLGAARRAQALHQRRLIARDRAIAEHCGVSDPFVGTIRSELQTVSSSSQPRVGKDGKVRPASNPTWGAGDQKEIRKFAEIGHRKNPPASRPVDNKTWMHRFTKVR